uniref:Uncharacterized protein n=1 Tax=Neogobius melanostomus TaxID=47308 RepID=A0A8C6TW54_9GOBI
MAHSSGNVSIQSNATCPRHQAGVVPHSKNYWLQIGTKPKAPTSSTPRKSEEWIGVPASKAPLKPGSHHADSITLANRFNILDNKNFPLLPTLHSTQPGNRAVSVLHTRRPGTSSGTLGLSDRGDTPAAPSGRASNRRKSGRSSAVDVDQTGNQDHAAVKPNPSVLASEASIVRHTRFFNAVTHCLPGATVSHILHKLPSLLESAPESVHSLCPIYVGTNETARQQSEITKRDFKALFAFLRSVNLSVFISGTIPTWSRGDLRFSRLLALNTWLHAKCIVNDFVFINNFESFKNRPALFNRDGLHLSGLGCHMLLKNVQHVVQTNAIDKSLTTITNDVTPCSVYFSWEPPYSIERPLSPAIWYTYKAYYSK